MNKSGISWLLFMFMLGVLMFMMLYADRHLSNSIADRRLHLARSLRKADMPTEQASALLDAIDGVGQEARSILMTIFLPVAMLIPMAFADLYDVYRRVRKLEAKARQPPPALQADER